MPRALSKVVNGSLSNTLRPSSVSVHRPCCFDIRFALTYSWLYRSRAEHHLLLPCGKIVVSQESSCVLASTLVRNVAKSRLPLFSANCLNAVNNTFAARLSRRPAISSECANRRWCHDCLRLIIFATSCRNRSFREQAQQLARN